MSNDLVAKARRKLADVQPAKPVDPDKGKELHARARTLIGAKQTLVAAQPPEPRAERVKLMMTCSERGLSYLVIAERHDDERGGYELRFVSHEMPPPGPGGTRLPGRLSGRYRIELPPPSHGRIPGGLLAFEIFATEPRSAPARVNRDDIPRPTTYGLSMHQRA